MSTPEYRLPCPCGEVIIVQKRQAGQSVSCESCGKSQDVPTMLGLEKLERTGTDDSEEDSQGKPEVKTGGGCLFSTCLAIGSTLLIAALVLYLLSVFWTPKQTIESSLEQANSQLDTLEFEDLIAYWDQVDQSGLGEAIPPWFVTHALIARRLKIAASICGIVSGLAMLVAGVMFIRDFRVVRE